MAVISSRFNISVPSTDILTYIFDSPWDSTQGYPDDEPIILSAEGIDQPSCTFNELKHLVKCFACGFKTLAPSNPRVVLYGTLNVYLPAVLLGALGAGASCNICPAYPLAETSARLRTINADYVFFQPEHLETVTAAAKIAGVPAENLFILDESKTCEKLQFPASHWASLLDFINGPSFQWKRLSDDESKNTTALFVYTSGTTGTPKLAQRTHYGLIGNTAQLLYRYYLKPRERHETWFCTFLYPGTGFILYGLLMPLKARYKTIFMPQFDIDGFLSAVEAFQPTSLHTPKHIFQSLLADSANVDFSCISSLRTGGAMIPLSMRDEWVQRHGSQCEVVCGMTEGGIHFASDPRQIVSDETVGELLPNLQAKVVDHNGQILPVGQSGEILIRNPFAMTGYLNGLIATNEVFTDDGYIKTGDVGMVNESGRWYIIGRLKDLYKREGIHVIGSEIEAAVLSHPEVLTAAVIAVKLPKAVDDEPVPRGYLVRRLGSTLTPDEFDAWAVTTLPKRFQLEGGCQILEALPVSMAGKVDRTALRQRSIIELMMARGA